MARPHSPCFHGLHPAHARARRAAQGSSRKAGTRCERQWVELIASTGLAADLHRGDLPGHPDLVIPALRLAIFVDGDFWHGRDLQSRLSRLSRGHNAAYWMAKLRRNVERDQRVTEALTEAGWRVLRFWETDLRRNPGPALAEVLRLSAWEEEGGDDVEAG